MATATELFAAGELRQAIAVQRAIAARRPDDPAAGLLHFELLAAAGLTESALAALKAIVTDDDTWKPAFRKLLKAAAKREANARPQSPVDVPDYVTDLRKATVALKAGDAIRALRAVDRANSRAPDLRGTLDGEPFEGLRDGDDRTAFVLEFFCDGAFIWVPFAAIKSLRLDDPAGPLDHVYRPALVRLTTGESLVGHVPLVAAGTTLTEHGDRHRLGLDSDSDVIGDVMVGIGGKSWLVGEEIVDVATIRMLEFAGPARVGLL
jgi:type VI secretion system protein ImpE